MNLFPLLFLFVPLYGLNIANMMPNEIEQTNQLFASKSLNNNAKVAILLLTCNRDQMVVDAIGKIIQIRRQTRQRLNQSLSDEYLELPLIVSHDCDDRWLFQYTQSIENASDWDKVFAVIHNPHYRSPLPNIKKHLIAYYRIAKHYHWALGYLFDNLRKLEHVIIIEDDLVFSRDILTYFLTLVDLYKRDPSLYCISAWNDNGKLSLVDLKATGLVHRSDFFPGLGWMIKRSIWNEIKPRWPKAYWDDWMRAPAQRRGRQCLRPEISRTQTIGRIGASQGQFYDHHLKHIIHFRRFFHFYHDRHRLYGHLEASNYTHKFMVQVYQQSIEISPYRLRYSPALTAQDLSYKITYHNRRQLSDLTSLFGLMNDFKFGVPRTAYQGVVSFFWRSMRVYLAPSSYKSYFVSWN